MNFSEPAQATEWRPKIAHGETVGFNSQKNKAPDGAKEKIRGLIFCRPGWGWKFFLGILPTVSPWATFCRASGALAAIILFFAVGATSEPTNTLSDAEIQGRQLAQQLLEQRPATNLNQNGILKIRDKQGTATSIFASFETIVTADDWQTIYEAKPTINGVPHTRLKIIHKNGKSNRYSLMEDDEHGLVNIRPLFSINLDGNQTMIPFAKSDFWIADLGLEFFHWPAQKVLPKPTNLVRGREYTLLESTNPNPSTNGYSRVLSWIDKETGGPLQAEAYDANGRLLKEFAPKSFKKVNGQWELQEMEIRNVQTGSRTRLEFDLNKQ
jgi:hypothetical protein